MPLLILLILVIAQFALWAHATHIAQVAAAQALSANRIVGGTTTAGTTAATTVLTQLGDGPLHDPHVTAGRDQTHATVTISGTATSLVPFLTLPVHAEAVGPIEAFIPATGVPR